MNEDIVIDEVVQLETEGEMVKFERAEYSTVVFHNIAETYPEDAHIECCYTVTPDLVPTTRDWVGLYKVGWMSPQDYMYYEWAPIPKNYRVGFDADASVLFPAHKMPKDDGEFYQFCYVASSSQIRGASTPFQFKRPGYDDYVEVEDEETDMLVIRSKTVFLEENLQKAEVKRIRLEEAQEALQKERDEIVSKYQELKKKLSHSESENQAMNTRLAEEKVVHERMKVEAHDMNLLQDELQEKITKLKEERQKQEKIISELEEQIVVLKREMVNQRKQNDELTGHNVQLQGEVQMYKDHFSKSQTNIDEYSKQKEELQLRQAQNESMIEHQRGIIETLKVELEDNKQNLDKQTAINFQDKDQLAAAEERLKNAEDKLAAAEESKECLRREISTFEETQAQLSRQIENSKSECEGLKHKLCALEEDFSKKNSILQQEMDQTTTDLQSAIQEKATLQKRVHQLQTNLSETREQTGVSMGSMSIMQQSLTQIKQRLEKKEKQCRQLERHLKTREEEHIQRERELQREVEDLMEKIQMCSQEYKSIYIEKSRLEKKLEKLSKKKARQQKLSESFVEVEKEGLQTTAYSDKDETSSCTGMSESLDMEKQLEGLEVEMQRGLDKKGKYKALYRQEKEQNEELRRQNELTLSEKEEEIDRLKAAIKAIPSSKDLKIQSLEKCVSDKEKTIDELNDKLRQCNQGRSDESGASTPQPRSAGSPPNYPGHVVDNNQEVQQNRWLFYPNPAQPVQYPAQHVQYPDSPVMYQRVNTHYLYPQTPPMTYPTHFSVQRTDTETIDDDQQPTSNPGSIMDKLETEGLEKPLTPLPAPMAPQVVKQSKGTERLEYSRNEDVSDVLTLGDLSSETDLKVALPGNQLPTGPPADFDRFYDAEGTGMKYCQECSKAFSADVSDSVFEEHQLSHIVGICPFCKMMKCEEMSDQEFEHHVNKHIEER